jgi:hypothetical protein
MKKFFISFALIALTTIIAGCCSSSLVVVKNKDFNGQQLTVNKSQAVAHINYDVYSYYIFKVIPVLSGDARHPGKVMWFTEPYSSDDMLGTMSAHAKKMGANRLVDLASINEGSWLLEKNSLPLPIWVVCMIFGGIWIEETQMSANAVKMTE